MQYHPTFSEQSGVVVLEEDPAGTFPQLGGDLSVLHVVEATGVGDVRAQHVRGVAQLEEASQSLHALHGVLSTE